MNTVELDLETGVRFFAVLVVVFGLLYFANSSNELLKQLVLAPAALTSLAGEADCRADELIEEGLSLRECELMRVQLEIAYESSPNWFRSMQLFLHSLAVMVGLGSLYFALNAANLQLPQTKLLRNTLVTLTILDVAIFTAALQTGPLLRAQYLWPTLIWFFVHLSLAIAAHSICAIISGNSASKAAIE